MKRIFLRRVYSGAAIAAALAAAPAAVLSQGTQVRPPRTTPAVIDPGALERPSSLPGRPTLVSPAAGGDRGTSRPPGPTLVWRHGGQPVSAGRPPATF